MKLGSKSHYFRQSISDDNSVTVLQKISKGQASDTINGIKYAKDVKTYFMTDEDGNPLPLLGLGNGSGSVYTGIGLHAIGGGTQGYNTSFYYDFINAKVYAQTLNFKSKGGYNYIDVDEYDEANVKTNGFKLGCGDVWVLGDRYVKRFNCKDNKFEKLYKVDGGMTNLHCSLPTDVVVWDTDKECYSIVYPKASAEDKNDATTTETAYATTEATVLTTVNGWIKNTDGIWNYIKADGTKATGWYCLVLFKS